MKIAHIGSLCIPVPPVDYGGTERAIAQISVFQAATRGHEVTVYASMDSELIDFAVQNCESLGLQFTVNADGSSIEIINQSGARGSLKLRHNGFDAIGFKDPEEVLKDRALADALVNDDQHENYNIVHCHVPGLTQYLLPTAIGHKVLTHLHGNGLNKGYADNRYPVICISNSQARTITGKFNAEVAGVVLHGMDTQDQVLYKHDAGYLAWIGRIIDKKGTHLAIEIAQKAGLPLIMAGTTYGRSTESADYFAQRIEPLIDVTDKTLLDQFGSMNTNDIASHLKEIQLQTDTKSPIIFVGAANEIQKQTLLGNAKATLFPILWSEPFGLVMIESMACGTPVIAPAKVGKVECGSVPEVIENGVTGFSFDALDEEDLVNQSVNSIYKAEALDRGLIHQKFQDNWSSQRVAADMDVTYQRFLDRQNMSLIQETLDI